MTEERKKRHLLLRAKRSATRARLTKSLATKHRDPGQPTPANHRKDGGLWDRAVHPAMTYLTASLESLYTRPCPREGPKTIYTRAVNRPLAKRSERERERERERESERERERERLVETNLLHH